MGWFSEDLITEPSCSSLVWRDKLERPLQTLPPRSGDSAKAGDWGREPDPWEGKPEQLLLSSRVAGYCKPSPGPVQGGQGDIVSALRHLQVCRHRKELGAGGEGLPGMALFGKASAPPPPTWCSGSEWQMGSCKIDVSGPI